LFVQNGVLVGKMFVLKVLDDLRTMWMLCFHNNSVF
jgi:hypothetical protein